MNSNNDLEGLFLISDIIQMAEAIEYTWYYNNPNGADSCNHCGCKQTRFNENHNPDCPVLIARSVVTGYEGYGYAC